MRRRVLAKPLALVAAPADTTAPTVPTNVTASSITATGFTLSWSTATDAVGVTGYVVQIDGVTYATPTGTSIGVAGRSASTAYAVRVQARDAAGNFSALSTAITVTTSVAPDLTAPTVPTNVTASSLTASGFTVSWSASTDAVGVTGYAVLLGGVQYGTTAGTSLAVTGRAASTAYSVQVLAFDAAGNTSTPSTAITATTTAAPDVTAPTVPTGVTASSVTSSGFVVSWTASTDAVGVTGYDVQIDGTSYATPTNTSVAVTGRTASTAYAVRVRARDAAGNFSALSTAITATTSAASAPAPSPRGWWKADAITGLSSGAAVASWSDSAGSTALAQATAGQRPIYRSTGSFLPNGKPVVEFVPASSTFLSTTTGANSGPMTRFVVFSQRSNAVAARQTLFASPTGYELSIEGSAFIGSTSVDAAATAASVALNVWYVLAFASDGSTGAGFYVNGVKETPVVTAFSVSGSGFDFGARGNSTRMFDGYVAEVLDYSTVLSDADVTTTSNYLMSKYAITAATTTGVPQPLTGYWRSDFSSATALTPSSGSPAVGAEWSGWGQDDQATYGVPALVSAATEGISAPPSGDRVAKLRHSGASSPFGSDFGTGLHNMHKFYKQFTTVTWPGGAEPTNRNDGAPADVSGRYITYLYFRSSQMNFVSGYWSNTVQFKEDYFDTNNQFHSDPSWWLGFNSFNNPASPVFNLSCWGGTHNNGVTKPLSSVTDRWVKFEMRIFQGVKVEAYIDDVLFDTGLQAECPVGRRNTIGVTGSSGGTVKTSLGWTFGVGNYTNGNDFPAGASGVYVDLSTLLPLP